MAKTAHIRLKDRTLENDIKYRAPLSYRYLRIIAWICLIIAQIGMVAKLNIRIVPGSEQQIGWVKDMGEIFATFPLPLFLLANFAVMYQKRDSWKKLIMFYGGVALGLYIVGNLVIIHYGYGFVNAFAQIDFMDMAKGFGLLLFGLGKTGLVFNIFIDLFLCALVFYFLNYNPKTFKGKKIYIFRSFVLIPILYEVGSILIKYFVSLGQMDLPFFVFFLLTSKPPLMFAAIVALFVILKIEELRKKKKYLNNDFVKEHRKTNAHSLRFSIIIAITFFIAGIIDLIIYLSTSLALASRFVADVEDIDVASYLALYVISHLGFGDASTLLLIAPLTLLFSYTKVHKNKKIDPLIPVVGIALILFVYVEGIFQIVVVNVAKVVQAIKDILGNFE